MTTPFTEKQKQTSIWIYKQWFEQFRMVQDKEYQRYLYGVLIKYYLSNCRNKKITRWEIDGIDTRFAVKYALNVKERVKVLLFSAFPTVYVNLNRIRKSR